MRVIEGGGDKRAGAVVASGHPFMAITLEELRDTHKTFPIHPSLNERFMKIVNHRRAVMALGAP